MLAHQKASYFHVHESRLLVFGFDRHGAQMRVASGERQGISIAGIVLVGPAEAL